ncbi:MAG TPA: SAM-dependent methyltransferase, partial [Spirochaetota bacterium]|nr:SAM-dependent methyltransferase [Spirochaetota bacterium]
MTLIQYLIDNFNIDDKKANGLILSGMVLIDEKVITKPKIKVTDRSIVRIKPQSEYVSRGAYKLLTAFKTFNLDVKDKICMDVGSSTGGFTEILLLNGAKKVYAIDCGNNQLDYKLRVNKRVILHENTKITDFKKTNLISDDKIEIAVMDVSFTGCINIINYLFKEFFILKLV